MKLREVSDVHSEFYGEDEIARISLRILPPLPDDHNTVLLLAGDIGSMSRPECLVNFLDAVCPRFDTVLYIPGNHESYGGDIQTTPDKIRALTKHIPNIYFNHAANAPITGRNTRIHMHTLWTDFDKENPMSMYEAGERMNDYRLIRNGGYVLSPQDTLEFHKEHLAILEDDILPGDIVMTHHTPSLQCIPTEYADDRVNGAYHSDLEDLIIRKKPSYWFCGHTHTAKTLKIGDTTVIINPHGYGKHYTKNGYNPLLVVEI